MTRCNTARFNFKIPVFLFSLIVILCLGLIYGWSVFVVPLEKEFGWARSETSLTFTISMISLTLGVMTGGQMNKKKDRPFVTLTIAAVLLFTGFAMTSRAELLMQFFGFYGVLCGFGVGLGYVELIGILTKWFDGKHGLVSGVLMMCFGMGAMVLGTTCSVAMDVIGWRKTFLILGIIFGILTFADGVLIHMCSGARTDGSSVGEDHEEGMTTREMILSSDFKVLYTWLIFISAAGLALMGHIAPCAMHMGAGAASAALIAGVVSASNGAGRIIFGIIYDKLGVKKSIFTICIVFICASLITLFAIITENLIILVIGAVFIGMSFGSAPTSSSAVVKQFYGTRYFSANFGVISTQIVISALVGQFMAGKLYMVTGDYTATFYCVAFLSVIAAISAVAVIKTAQKNNRRIS